MTTSTTTTLFAALNILDGVVIGRCMQKHRHQEFIRFLNAVERYVPTGMAIHVERIAREKYIPVQRVASYKASGVLDEFVRLPEAQSEAVLSDAVAGTAFGLDHLAAAGRAWAIGDLRTVRASISPAETLAVFLHTSAGQQIGARSVDDTTAALRSALAKPGTTVAVMRLAP